jgi:S1-C subfamily serine protease
MSKKIVILILFFLLPFLFSQAKAEDQEKTFRIMTESDSGDYIGQNQSWDFSNENNSKITVVEADEDSVVFRVEDFNVSYMTFEFASESGKTISPGLYTPAKRFPFRGSYNGINISGDGRGCNEILGAFYVHEYVFISNGTLEKAAIDFVQICEPGSNDLSSNNKPRLYGSLRYNSNVPDSCNSQGCAEAKKNLGVQDIQTSINNQRASATNNANIITDASDLPKADAHKAIVKIKSFALNSDYELSLFGSGSGVIIDSSGIVLTNYHVVVSEDDFDGSVKESSYIICLTEETNKEPDCEYTGKFMAGDKDLDVALLKIDGISGLSDKSSFSYLNLSAADETEVNDEITALGYPAIGGDTITITKGVISGKESKYNKDWIKTDAVVSYGSSGGAAIDANGNVVGITSSSHSDRLGSLGYIINIDSLSDWINANKRKTPQSNSLVERTAFLAKKIVNSKNSNEFINDSPAYKITKPSDWDFTHEDETALVIDKESDDEGGVVMISSAYFPYAVDTGIVEASVKRDLLFLISIASIVKNEDAVISGRAAKRVVVSAVGQQSNYYYIPVGNSLLKIIYDYGDNDKDKTIIDSIINSISIIGDPQYVELTNYSQDNPKFSISLNNGWVLLPKNSKTSPLFIAYKGDKSALADVRIKKTDDNTKDMNSEEYLKFIEQGIKEANSLTSMYDLREEITNKDAHYKLSDNLPDVIMVETVKKSISAGEALYYRRAYYVKAGDKYIMASLKYYGANANDYNDVADKFNEALGGFRLDSRSAVGESQNIARAISVKNKSMYSRLKGKIMLKVEDKGKAYYVNPETETMHYLGRPEDAFAVMREQGVGITNSNLEKIPVGLGNLTGPDTDGDGLPDLFEDAIGTNKNNMDSDGDGYNDKVELENNYNPNGSGILNIDNSFSAGQKGKIFLQVERNGEAWYINPNDGKRYFLGRPADAFNVMRNLGLGISNKDFDSMK